MVLYYGIGLLFFVNPIICNSCKDLATLSNFLQYVESVLNQAENSVRFNRRYPGAIDCDEIMKRGNKQSGMYRIWPLNWEVSGSFEVYCDMETDGGGWTVIQRRGNYSNPKDYFFKEWEEYRTGFGELNKEFWLGNDKIFSLTNQGNYSLRIDMKDKEEEKRFATYANFWIENERQFYKLHVSDYSGDVVDSFSYMNGLKFTTKDKDNDVNGGENCATLFKGGWWYDKCHSSNLNGLNLNGPHESYADGIEWYGWKQHHYSLPYVDMKIRPTTSVLT